MIITVTVNPAIDRTLTVDRLVFDDRTYIRSSTESAGGRGINASQVIHSFGGDTLAIMPSGGEAGQAMEAALGRYGFKYVTVPIAGQVRVNLTITDSQGLTVKLNELGPALSAAETAALEAAVLQQLPHCRWLMLCGSLPPNVPTDLYARLIRHAKTQGVSVLLDTDNEALADGLLAGPDVVAPNQQETERLLGTALITRSQFLSAVESLHQRGAQSVLLSLGSRGVLALHGQHLYEAVPPRIDAVCPIGAGDAMGAAFVWSLRNGGEFMEALRWGVAAGTASAKLPGVTFADLEQTKQVYQQVEVRQIA